MAPFLSIGNNANPGGTIDMTALTSAGGVWTALQGETGADWAWYRGSGTYSKTDGGTLVTITTFGSGLGTTGVGAGLTGTWTVADENSQATPTNSQNRFYDIGAGNIDVGIKWVGLAAPPNQRRTFTYIGTNIPNGATFTAKITLASGAYTAQTVVMNSTQGFTCSYTGGSYTDTVDIEIRCTVAAPSFTCTLFAQATYIGVPVLAKRANGWQNYLRQIGIFGTTANA